MKAYKFKIEAVLKLRKIKEEKCRMELGKLVASLNMVIDQIQYDKNQVDQYSGLQEIILNNPVSANKIQFIPYLVEGKKKNINLLDQEKIKIEKMIEDKKRELSLLKSDLKVIEKLKEKDFEEFKRDYNKKLSDKIEEQAQIWINNIEKEDLA